MFFWELRIGLFRTLEFKSIKICVAFQNIRTKIMLTVYSHPMFPGGP